jgi:eukaryotic-like serine/threonine-protein kinase
LTARGHAKILDFGLAKLTRSPAARMDSSMSTASALEESLSMPEVILGTVAYMSPEQVRGEELDSRTDLFSFGLVIYEMATGFAAFTGSSVGVIFDAILNRQPVSPSQLNRAVLPKLEEIINRALEKDRKLRHQTARDMEAELQRLKRDVESRTATAVGPASPVRTRSYKKAGLLTGGFAIVGLLLLLAIITRTPEPNPKPTVSYRISNDGRQKEPLASPNPVFPMMTDGARIYFTEIGAGDLSFAQVSAAGGDTVTVDTPFRFPQMADISLDHAQLLLFGFAGSELESTLWTQPTLGGTPRRVGDLEGHDATWSPSGEILYANGSSLYEAKVDGSGIRKLVTVPGSPFWPRWAPDGRVLRFTVRDPGSNSTSLWEASADGTNPRPLLPGWNDPPGECCGNWTPDGKYFAFQSSRHNQTDIWALKEKGSLWKFRNRGPVQVTAGPMNFLAPVFSQDGESLFLIGEQRRGELVRYDAKAKQFVPYLSGISADGLDFSRTGDWVAYVSYPDETLWRSKIDGTQKQQLTFPPLAVGSPEWSPDGKEVAFSGLERGKTSKIYIISAGGGNPVEVLPGSQVQQFPSWSADGSFLVFSGRQPSEVSDTIFMLDVRSHGVSVLPGSTGLGDPKWSPDGRYIAAMTMDSQKLLLFDTQARTWMPLAQAAIGYLNWSKDSNYLYFDTFGDAPSIVRIRVRGGTLETVASLKDLHRAWGRNGPWSGVAPDDSSLATRDAGSQEVYLIRWPGR